MKEVPSSERSIWKPSSLYEQVAPAQENAAAEEVHTIVRRSDEVGAAGGGGELAAVRRAGQIGKIGWSGELNARTR
jgi:hypothetical protein